MFVSPPPATFQPFNRNTEVFPSQPSYIISGCSVPVPSSSWIFLEHLPRVHPCQVPKTHSTCSCSYGGPAPNGGAYNQMCNKESSYSVEKTQPMSVTPLHLSLNPPPAAGTMYVGSLVIWVAVEDAPLSLDPWLQNIKKNLFRTTWIWSILFLYTNTNHLNHHLSPLWQKVISGCPILVPFRSNCHVSTKSP